MEYYSIYQSRIKTKNGKVKYEITEYEGFVRILKLEVGNWELTRRKIQNEHFFLLVGVHHTARSMYFTLKYLDTNLES